MSIALVQASTVASFGGEGPGSVGTISLTGTHAGNMLALMVSGIDSAGKGAWSLSNVSDGANTWSNPTTGGRVLSQNHWLSASIYDALNIAGGTATISMKNSNTTGVDAFWYAQLLEFSGVLLASANDSAGNGSANGDSTGPLACTGGTLTSAGDLVLLNMATDSTSGTGLSAPPVGWTNEGHSFTSYPYYSFDYILPGSTAALSPSYGMSGNVGFWGVSMAAYKPAPVNLSRQRSRRSRGY